jgi:hypothetical protein
VCRGRRIRQDYDIPTPSHCPAIAKADSNPWGIASNLQIPSLHLGKIVRPSFHSICAKGAPPKDIVDERERYKNRGRIHAENGEGKKGLELE